ncbi:MAG: HAMP domain-containing protein [Gammaproteobacteria bacterium]|nr:HAMP domain-containing protein [Gammaproteobacteria bacterium]
MKLKLVHKLLIAIFACTALVLVLITLVTRAGIGRGFVDFLQQQERNQVEQLVPELASWYSERGSWDELADNHREFYYLVFKVLLPGSEDGMELQPEEQRGPPRGAGRGPRFAGEGPGGPRPGGPRPGRPGGQGPGSELRNTLPQRIYLLDSAKSPVIGNISPGSHEDILLPVEANGAVVGWLGIAMIRGVKLPEEEAFITALRNNLLLGLGIGLVVAALLAWLLARHLSRPINEVAEGIRALAAGNFNKQITTRGSDEIAKLGDDVNRLSITLSEHETARKRWMSDMAHELRTPLAIISGELEAMSDGVRPLNKEQLASVQEEVKHMASLVDDLHSLTMTDSGALAYKMRKVDLNELIQFSVDSFEGRAAKKDLKLSYANPQHTIGLLGDEQRLGQLLRNLLDNAVRYTDAGGGISIDLKKDGQQAKLTISDTTPGASVEECERMFERLYRLESSRNRNSGGSGLGLAICRNIVEAHGGQITAEPGPDGGLMFTTILPLEI